MSGTTSSAFLNKDTGKVIVGMTGTNVHMEKLVKFYSDQYNLNTQDQKDIKGTVQDVGADVNIGIKSVTHF
ncbi:hypothetical protein NGB24_00135 [Mammaliicoccus vitulinus]|uniref:hypothetical protein n=1 Tax=Mammaliicoccus vitulinus TaxID=71237 RepID=UPI001AAD9C69|nr:hypothetical protein [Mammaliicoccus vitulinus]MBO3076501.1 hypothetical protein [Mammaliicoccus vitulinus]MEB7656241.1 hypothetical protein [Mammaliicoccus vitulinus]